MKVRSNPTTARPAKALRYAIYARFSDKEEGAFASTDAQIAICTEYVTTKGGAVAGVYRESDRTGTNLNRPQWKKLLADSTKGLFDVVVVTFMSRLGRGEQFTLAKHELAKSDVSIELVKETFTDDLAGYAARSVTQLVDGMYPRMVAEWTRTKMLAMLAEGLHTGGSLPVGYILAPAHDLASPGKRTPKRHAPDPERVELAREAFATYLSTGSIATVRDLLADETGQAWRLERTKDLLRNRAYIGQWSWGEAINETHHEGIIDPELFHAVQVKLDQKKHRTINPDRLAKGRSDSDNLLVGRVRCVCGQSMPPGAAKGRGGRYPYYICYHVRMKLCRNRVNANTLHELLVGELIRMGKHPWRIRQTLALAAGLLGDPKELQGAHRAALRLQRTEEEAVKRLAADLSGNLGGAARAVLLRELDARAELAETHRLEAERLALEVSRAGEAQPTARQLEALLSRFGELWEAANESERRQVLRGFVHQVVVTSTKPLTLEAEIYSDFGVFSGGSKFEVLSSTGSQITTKRGG
jgi:site-specific DNA recombinase